MVDDRVECRYRVAVGSSSNEITYVVWVSWTQPNFGGQRPWLHCAHPLCQRRCGRLFLDDPYLVCRSCAKVRYPSQMGEKAQHAQRFERAKALRAELGGEPAVGDPLPPRPKGMHRQTYERLCTEVLQIERAERPRIDPVVRTATRTLRQMVGTGGIPSVRAMLTVVSVLRRKTWFRS